MAPRTRRPGDAPRRALPRRGHCCTLLRSLLSPVDQSALGGDLGDYFAENFRVALAPGVEGWVEDDLAFVAPWGFGLGDVGEPLLIWQGHEDLMVPPAHGEWLAARADGAEAHLSREDGHLTLLERRVAGVHEWLLAHAGVAQ